MSLALRCIGFQPADERRQHHPPRQCPGYTRSHFGERWLPCLTAMNGHSRTVRYPHRTGIVLAFEAPWYVGVSGRTIDEVYLTTDTGHEAMNRLPIGLGRRVSETGSDCRCILKIAEEARRFRLLAVRVRNAQQIGRVDSDQQCLIQAKRQDSSAEIRKSLAGIGESCKRCGPQCHHQLRPDQVQFQL